MKDSPESSPPCPRIGLLIYGPAQGRQEPLSRLSFRPARQPPPNLCAVMFVRRAELSLQCRFFVKHDKQVKPSSGPRRHQTQGRRLKEESFSQQDTDNRQIHRISDEAIEPTGDENDRRIPHGRSSPAREGEVPQAAEVKCCTGANEQDPCQPKAPGHRCGDWRLRGKDEPRNPHGGAAGNAYREKQRSKCNVHSRPDIGCKETRKSRHNGGGRFLILETRFKSRTNRFHLA